MPENPWQPVQRRPGLRSVTPDQIGSRKVTVIGTSHVEALRYALPPHQRRIEVINISREREGVPLVTPDEWRDASDSYRSLFKATFDPDRHFVSMLGGNDHNALGLIEHPQRFGLVEPGEEEAELNSSRGLIPYDAIRALLSGAWHPTCAGSPSSRRISPAVGSTSARHRRSPRTCTSTAFRVRSRAPSDAA